MFHNARVRVISVTLIAAMAVAGAASAAVSAGTAATTVSAKALPSSDTGSMFAHRGAAVNPAKLFTTRSFVNAKDGFALASVGQAQYPASTTNGGRTWGIDGPHFHVNAANAPDVVSRGGALGPSTYFAYGGGGNSVVVSSDAGRHWFRAYFSGTPLAVEPAFAGGRSLETIVQSSPGKFQVYLTNDGGRHWHIHHGFA